MSDIEDTSEEREASPDEERLSDAELAHATGGGPGHSPPPSQNQTGDPSSPPPNSAEG